MQFYFVEIKNSILYQTGALMGFTISHGMKLQHIKPHGALGNLAMVDENTARAICEAAVELDSSLYMFGHANSVMLKIAAIYDLKTVSEVYGDRAYMDDGTLLPRNMEGAVIHDIDFAVKRAVRMIQDGTMEAITGIMVVQVELLCALLAHASAKDYISKRVELEARLFCSYL